MNQYIGSYIIKQNREYFLNLNLLRKKKFSSRLCAQIAHNTTRVPFDGLVEQPKKLFQWCLVHTI